MSISLIDVEAVMPKKVVLNDYFGEEEARQKNRMFSGTIERRHMEREEMASDYFAQAAQNIFSRLNLDPQSDVDMILTNVSIPDESITAESVTEFKVSLPAVPFRNKSSLVFKFRSKPFVPKLKSTTVTGIVLSVTVVTLLLSSNVVAETLRLKVPV